MEVAILFAVVVGLMLIGVPIAVSLGMASILFLLALGDTSLASIAQTFFQAMAGHYTLLAIPFFILASGFMSTGGVARRIIRFSVALVGHVPGGLAIAGVFACMMFAALSGSSPATVVAIGSIVIAGMHQAGYTKDFAAGVIANAGTLGILIPPSTGFVIYAILTEQSIGRLFLSGVFPGLMLLGLFVLAITVMCWFKPELGPPGPSTSVRHKLKSMGGATPVLLTIILTIGGIYGGLFSPVEAAAVGAAVVILFGALSGQLSLKSVMDCATDSITTTAKVMLILIAAHLINPFLALSHIPQAVGDILVGLDLSVTATLVLILAIYLVLGCFLEGFAMLVLTLPIFFPIITDLGIDPIWFGVLVVLTLEMGLISPPVGLNVFIVKSVKPEVELGTIFKGILPFWLMMILAIVLLILFPQIALYLPNTMFG